MADTHVYRLSISIVSRDLEALTKMQSAVAGKMDASILDAQIHIVKDDAHPANAKP